MPDDNYKLADEPPPPRPRVRVPRTPAADDERLSEPIDLFPFLLGGAVLLWVGLGLAARGRPVVALALVAAGGVVLALGQLLLLWIIYQDDPSHAFWSLLSDWYQAVWCQLNAELIWRPLLVTACGLGMILTGLMMAVAKR